MLPLLRACHFPPTVAVTAVTTALAVSAGRGAGAVAVTAAVLAGQLSVGWSNDALDAERDIVAGRTDKPIAAGEIDRGTVARAAVLALAACVPLSMLSGVRGGLVHLGAVAAAWSYNAWLKRTVLSVAPYVLAFGALPAFVTLGLPGHPMPPGWAMGAGALLGGGAHFVNTLPDLVDDERTGVRGLPHRLGRRVSLLLGAALLGTATALVALGPEGELGALGLTLLAAAGLALATVVVAAETGRPRLAWTCTLVTAALAVASLLARGSALAAP